jgi:DNA primase catalytic core
MARIPETELERLKAEVSVQRLAEASGLELKKGGKDWLGRCPFHEGDNTPSLVVSPAKNLWHCFGCGAAGGPIDWVMKTRGVSFRHAVELLREGLPSSAAGQAAEAAPIKRTTVRALPAPVAFDADDAQLLGQVADYYHATLKQAPEALAYLETRGITGSAAAEAIDTFKLGYANRTLGLRLPEKTRKAGAEIRARLERLGVYRDSGHEHLNGSLVVPLFDAAGQVVNLYGRKVRNDLRAGTPAHLYLSGPRRGLFNRAALTPGACEELIVCEALIDALTFWCAGYRNVTSAYGIEGVTDELIEAIRAGGIARVLIAFDRDEPGERGAAKLAERLQALGIDCFRVVFPKGMDANEYAAKVQPAAKSLGLLIRKAEWLGKGATPKRDAAEPVEVANCDLKRDVPGVPSSVADDVPPTKPAAEEEVPALPAAAMPSAPAADAPAQTTERETVLVFGEGKEARRWRVRGLPKNLAVGVLKVNVMVGRRRWPLPRRYAGPVRGACPRRVRAAGIERTRHRRWRAQDRSRPRAAQARSLAGRGDPRGAGTEGASRADDDRSRAGRRARAAEVAGPDGAHRRGLRRLRRGGREDEQAGGLPGGGVATVGPAAGRGDPVVERGGQEQSHGRRAGLRAGGSEDEVQRDDGAEPVLHGADEPEAPHPRHC